MNDQIEVDVSGILDEETLHEYLFKIFDFPGYYGFNWDAFDECIRDASLPGKIIVTHFGELESKIPRCAALLRECLIDFAEERQGDIRIEFS